MQLFLAIPAAKRSDKKTSQEPEADAWKAYETLKSLSDNINLLKIVTRANI